MPTLGVLQKISFLTLGIAFLLLHGSEPRFTSSAQTSLSQTQEDAPQLVLQTGHGERVDAVVIDPKKKWSASAGFDNTIKIWDFKTGYELRTLTGHSGAVNTLACTPDSERLASGGKDRTVKIWDVKTGRAIRSMDAPDSVETVAFSPDGKYVAAGNWDGTIIVWNTETGKVQFRVLGHIKPVTAVAFSPVEGVLASGSEDKTIKVWDTGSGKRIKTLRKHSAKIRVLRFNANGGILASGGADKTVRLWQIPKGGQPLALKGHSGEILALDFITPDKLMTADSNRTTKAWDIKTGESKSVAILVDGDSVGEAQSAGFSGDGSVLAIGNGDRTVTFADTTTGKTLRKLESQTSGYDSVAFSADGRWLAAASRDNSVKLWDLEGVREVSSLEGHTGYVKCVVFHPDNRRIISGSVDGTIRIWDALSINSPVILGGGESVSSIDVRGKGRILASGHLDGTIVLWDLETNTQIGDALDGKAGEVISVSISPDEQFIVSGSSEGAFRLWDVASRKSSVITELAGELFAVAFGPDGDLFAAGGTDKTVRLQNVEKTLVVKKLEGFPDEINSVSFSPDGDQIAAAGWDKNVRIWNLPDGKMVGQLGGHKGTVLSATYSSKGPWLASASGDGSVILWNRTTGKQLSTLVSLKSLDSASDEATLDRADWAVVDPEGRFDASKGAQRLMHFSHGMEVIQFEQLKHGYYEPRLLQKVLGFNKEPLRKVDPFAELKLHPIVVETRFNRESKVLTYKLKSRDGGIGKTKIYVNNKLAAEDDVGKDLNSGTILRQTQFDTMLASFGRVGFIGGAPSQEPDVTGTVNLKGASFLTGDEDEIEVVPSSKDGNIQGRRGVGGIGTGIQEQEGLPPSFYAIVAGVSDYDGGNSIDLKFAAKDAEAISSALSMGAKRLFCEEEGDCSEKVQISTLSTDRQILQEQPTKENFERAFSEIAKKARPEDIVVIYLAGHGVSRKSDESDTYLFLTKEISSTTDFDQKRAISSKELTDWLTLREWTKGEKGIKALHQVLILDTCAAGTAATSMERAIEFLKDDTDAFALMGSSADVFSYEHPKYGHGLLTYSLLLAMKGARLEDDRVDVTRLFEYARTEVPNLARNLERVQQPMDFRSPLGKTFRLGHMTAEDKTRINIQFPVPIMTRPRLTDLGGFDDLDMERALEEKLRDESSLEVVLLRNELEPILKYVDVDERSFPGAFRVGGRYSFTDGKVRVKATLRRDKATIADFREIDGSKEEVISRLLELIRRELGKLPGT